MCICNFIFQLKLEGKFTLWREAWCNYLYPFLTLKLDSQPPYTLICQTISHSFWHSRTTSRGGEGGMEKLLVPPRGPLMWSSRLLPANRKVPRGHFSNSTPHQPLPITLTLINKIKPRLKLSSTNVVLPEEPIISQAWSPLLFKNSSLLCTFDQNI